MTAFKWVGVKFSSTSSTYTYKASMPLIKGDKVILKTPRGLVIGQCVGPADEPHNQDTIKYQWIVQRIEMAEYNRLTAEDPANVPG
jgi:cell fate regulator YaaT (PSP1 superfamily)